MRLTRLAASLALAVIATTTLSACSEDRADDALTIEDGKGAPLADQDDDQDEDDEFDRAGRLLSSDDIAAALPTVKDLPKTWARDTESENDEDDDDEDTIEPERCEELFGDDLDELDPEAEATRAFKADDFGPFLSVDVATYEEEVPDDLFDEIAAALSECKEFTSVDSEGEESKVKAEALSFPNLGEETLAVRMTFETDLFPAAINLAMVRIGHNMVLLSTVSIGEVKPNTKLMEKIGRETVKRLNS